MVRPISIALSVVAALIAVGAAAQSSEDAPETPAPPDGPNPPVAPGPEPHDPSWFHLAYRSLNRAGLATMHPDPSEGEVGAVRFEAQGRGLTIDRVRFEYQGEQEMVDMRPRQRIRAGEQGAPIELPELGVLRRVRVDCRVLAGRGNATLNLLAQRAE